jgi:hypothetical protein
MKSNSFKSTGQSLRSFTIELPKDPFLQLNDSDSSEHGNLHSGENTTTQVRSFNDGSFKK